MSESAVKAFFDLVSKNPAIRGEVTCAHAEGVVSVAAKHGLTFSAQDYALVATAPGQGGKRELGGSELSAVAGGAYQWGGSISPLVDLSLLTENPVRDPGVTPINLPKRR